MAFEVRELGPRLFERMIALKDRAEPNSTHVSRRWYTPVDRLTVLESSDLYRAIKSGAYQGRELAVLRYLYDHKNRIGQIVGSETTVCGHHGETHGYYVIALEDVADYDGNSRYPQARGNVFIAGLAALFFGAGGFIATAMALTGLVNFVLNSPAATMPAVIVSCLGGLVGAFYGARAMYNQTAQDKSDDLAAATLNVAA
jgi:hypothetical protein